MLKFSKKILAGVLLIIFLCINTYVSAEFDYTINLSGSKDITKGKIVNVTLSMDDIVMPPGEAIKITGALEYDRTVFEKIGKQNIETKNNWDVSYDEESGELSAKFSKGELKSGAICVLSFKVREDADIDKTAVVLKDLIIEVKNAVPEMYNENISVEFEYKENSSSIVNVPKENKNNIKISNQTKNTTTSNKSTNTIDQKKDNSDEIQLYIAIALLTVVIIAVIVVFAIMHRK